MALSRVPFLAAIAAFFLMVAGVPATAATGQSTIIYVSPHGSDTNSGTSPGRPLRSLQRAQALVRTLDQNMSGDIVVELASGTYRMSAPLSLTSADSGGNGHTVVWVAAPGAHPVVSGGERVAGWHLVNASEDLWAAPAPTGLKTRQLYVDGVRADAAAGPLPVSLKATATGYTASSDAMAGWRNPSDIEFVYTGGAAYWSLASGGLGAWTEPRCPIASISGTTITMAEPCWDNSTMRVNRTDGSGRTVNLVGPDTLGNHELPAYVSNAYEELAKPGQWYLDSSAGEVYYIPRQGQNMHSADVEAPVLQTLVSGQGVQNVTFSGIQFSYATWLTPSTPEGFSEIQANYTITGDDGYATQGLCQFVTGGTCPYGDWTQIPGNLTFDHDQNITFSGDAFTHLGAAGLTLGDGSQNDTVVGSVFTDISGNGVQIGGVDDPEPATAADHTTGNRILDDHLYNLPVEYHGGVAVDVGYAEHTLISHNQIDHTPYTAISLGWGGWPDKIDQPATPNYSNDNTVSDNLIDDTMQMLADGGAIYTQGITGSSLADGEHVTGNVALDVLDQNHAFYTDNGSTFITVSGNVAFGNWTDWGSRHTDYTAGATGDDPLAITGNYWQQGDPDNTAKNVTEADNHIISGLAQVPRSILDAAGIQPAYRSVLAWSYGASVPEQPTQVAAFGAAGSAYVGWNPPTSGSPTSYTVTASPGGAHVTVSAARYRKYGYAVVPGLTAGTPYTFAVTAANRYGDSAPSLPTSAVTPKSTAGTVPNPPTGVSVDADETDGTVSVHWTPPATEGGTPVISYTISAPGMRTVNVTGHNEDWANSSRALYTTIGGLKRLTPYTFSVTADNVAGASTPVAVGPVILAPTSACAGAKLTQTPSAVVQPGSTATVTDTVTNGCTAALSGGSLYLFAPAGYTVDPASPASLGTLAPGASATVTWKVGVPANATTSAQVVGQAVFSGDQGLRATTSLNVPAASLNAAFDNVGITDDANPTVGDIDGAGSSYSAEALLAAGAAPGGTITYDGVSYTWPSVAAGQPDNVVAEGNAFDMTGSGTTLSFLTAASYGPASGTGEVVYTDGTTQSYTLDVPDWHGGCKAGGANTPLEMPYRNRSTGQNTLTVCVYSAAVTLDPSKTVAMVVLPAASSGVVSGSPALHVFAATIS